MKNLEKIAQGTYSHEALNNQFYERWLKKSLSIAEIEVFARNYGAWVKSFPDTLAILFASTQDPEAKIELVSTLYSEMGYGKDAKVHWRLLDNFLNELADNLSHKGVLQRDNRDRIRLLDSTRKLIEGERNLYSNKDSSIAVGAQLALEWQAYTMLAQLYEGARNYKKLWKTEDSFHEACEYFYVHIGSAEKDHKAESLKAAEQYAKTETEMKKVEYGFNEHLNLIAEFWKGLDKEIESLGK